MEVITMSEIRLAGIVRDSIVDGPGLRYAIFVQGCFNKCEGCHNPQTHDPKGGYAANTDKLYEEFVSNPMYQGITFSGGEPFLQSDALADLAIRIKKNNKDKDIICYTGYTFEYLKDMIDKNRVLSYMRLLYNIDYLIDGPFKKNLASLDCKWRGSTNQRIIDVKQTITSGNIVLADI
jgi:anaerobic ribonucleoside-triphosphate reductase activating protein